MSWDDVVLTYNDTYMVDQLFEIVDTTGYYKYSKCVLKKHFNIPQYMMDIYDDVYPHPILMSHNLVFFDIEKYVTINFN